MRDDDGAADAAPVTAGAGGGAPADDPERRFRRLPACLGRWTLNTLWRRARLPARRRRWARQNAAAVAPYAKPATPRPEGTALAIGDFSGRSGLSRAALYELARLRTEHPDLEVLDAAAPGAPPLDGPPVGRLYLLSPPDSYPRLLPALPPGRVAQAHRTGLWVWETPIFPEDWRFALQVVHEIWTPSDYSRQALAGADAAVPVRLRPHAVSPPARVTPFDRRAAGVPEDAFLGVAIMDISSCPARKNPWAHVAAWARAFGGDTRHVLILKLRVAKRTVRVLDELREMIGDAGNIRLVTREFDEAGIAGLQRAGDVYLSLHRAEGYGLNIRECLEAGVPVVATDYSANAEYGPAYPQYHGVAWRAVPYRDWTGHYPDRRFTWAEADLGDAARQLARLAAAHGARSGRAGRP